MRKLLLIGCLLQPIFVSIQGKSPTMHIDKKVLKNGLTVLVRPNHTVPKVSVQLWYNVGSKDEKDGEKGIAHLIEHMMFKGTKEMLSETDIKVIAHMLSGNCNAFTSYDYTGYLFNMPSHNWRQVLPIMADCMVNTSFKDDHLNSEMKAVIQELKMLKDNHTRSVVYNLLTSIFPDHPYHYPLIGYKQDLWSVTGADLERFYKKHYLPNNATLIVVGDVDAQEVFTLAEQYFGAIPANFDYKREDFYHNPDIASKSVSIYRDVQQPIGIFAFVVPGAKEKLAHLTDVISNILGGGKSSRLYKKLIDERQLVTSLDTMCLDLFDHGLFLVLFTPKREQDIDEIEFVLFGEINDIVRNGVNDKELQTALKKAKMSEYSLLEKNEKQAYVIGKYQLACNDPGYVFTYLDIPKDALQKDIQTFLSYYCRPSVMHKGLVLPLPENDKAQWLSFQEASDLQDARILSARQRETQVEMPKYAQKIQIQQPTDFNFPKAQEAQLENGMKLFWYKNDQTPKINLVLEFKAKSWNDPQDKQGLFAFVTRMMTEGTKNYTANELAEEFESRGMAISMYPGGISMSLLHEDLQKGLELLNELLTNAIFSIDAIEKVRAQMLSELKQFWDNPDYFSSQLMSEMVYKGHPFSKNSMGTVESVLSITQKDLIDFYNSYISPDGAKCAIVGDLRGYDIKAEVQKTLGNWNGSQIDELEFPEVQDACAQEKVYPINRDQVTLMMAKKSIDRKNSDYDKLLIFDQIFGGSLHSRLYQLREQSGLFYTINGSTIAQSGLQPGMVVVRTLVSKDRAHEAEKAIKEMMKSVSETLTDQEIAEAKNALASNLVSFFDSNANIAQAFLFLDKYGFNADYFDHRAKNIAQITLQEVKDAASRYLLPDEMCVLRIGRLD
ncbi:MAG: pitrilysin family protein [Candidatus Dependentiae bacterium]